MKFKYGLKYSGVIRGNSSKGRVCSFSMWVFSISGSDAVDFPKLGNYDIEKRQRNVN